MLEEPSQVSVLVLVLVELFELTSNIFHFWRESTGCCILLGPVSICENFSHEFNLLIFYLLASLSTFEFIHQILGEIHICEHLRYSVDGVMTTFNLQLLQHEFLCIF